MTLYNTYLSQTRRDLIYKNHIYFFHYFINIRKKSTLQFTISKKKLTLNFIKHKSLIVYSYAKKTANNIIIIINVLGQYPINSSAVKKIKNGATNRQDTTVNPMIITCKLNFISRGSRRLYKSPSPTLYIYKYSHI